VDKRNNTPDSHEYKCEANQAPSCPPAGEKDQTESHDRRSKLEDNRTCQNPFYIHKSTSPHFAQKSDAKPFAPESPDDINDFVKFLG